MEAEFLEAGNKRGRPESKQLGGAAGTMDLPTGFGERGDNIPALLLAHLRFCQNPRVHSGV
jgi:hypothetical protein